MILRQVVSALKVLRVLSYYYMKAVLAARSLKLEESTLYLSVLLKGLRQTDLSQAPFVG